MTIILHWNEDCSFRLLCNFFDFFLHVCPGMQSTDKNNRPQNFRYALKTFFSRNARLEVEVNILK